MSKKMAMIGVFCSGIVVSIVGLTWFGGGTGSPTGPAAQAADKSDPPPKVTRRQFLHEQMPNRSVKVGNSEVRIGAKRHFYEKGDPEYFITIYTPTGNPKWASISPEDAPALLKLAEFVKGKTKSDAKEVMGAYVHFYSTTSDGEQHLEYYVVERTWVLNDVALTDDFFTTLKEVLKDLEQFRKAKPSFSLPWRSGKTWVSSCLKLPVTPLDKKGLSETVPEEK